VSSSETYFLLDLYRAKFVRKTVHSTLKTLKFVQLYIVILAFLGLLTLAMVSLISLSPIGYEDYQLAQNAQKNVSDLAANASLVDNIRLNGQVAGVSTQSVDLQIENLLEGQNLPYTFNQDASAMTLIVGNASLGNARLQMLRFNNPSDSSKTLALNFAPEKNANILTSLSLEGKGNLAVVPATASPVSLPTRAVDAKSSDILYELTILANSTSYLALLRVPKNSSLANELQKPFGFKLSGNYKSVSTSPRPLQLP